MADKMFGISLQDQRAKYLLVAVLAAILLAVVAWPGETSPASSGVVAATRPQPHSAAATDTGSSPAQPSSSTPLSPQGRWAGGEGASVKSTAKKPPVRKAFAPLSDDELKSLLSFNPFVPSALLQAQLPGTQVSATEQQVREELAEKARVLAAEQRLNEFRGKKVRVVFQTADGRSAALIGDKLLVREGEIIDGVRILSISPNGVVVEAAPPH